MAEPDSACGFRYLFASDTSPSVGASVAHSDLAQSVVDALATHLAAGCLPVSVRQVLEDDAAEVAAALRGLDQRSSQLEARCSHLRQAITSGDVSGRLLRDLSDEYASLTDETASVQSQRDELLLEQERRRAARELALAQRRAEDILLFVSHLRDPHSTVAQRFFGSCVRELTFTVRYEPDRTRVLSWSGTIALASDDATIEVPFSGAVPARQAVGTESWAVERLKRGAPLLIDSVSRRFADGLSVKIRAGAILPEIGLRGEESWIIYVADALLLEVYLSHFADGYEGPTFEDLSSTLASDFRDVPALESAVLRTHHLLCSLEKPTWIRRYRRDETNALISLARGSRVEASALIYDGSHRPRGKLEHWDLRDDAWSCAPCRHCGSSRRMRLVIPEPSGYVCYDCRLDPSGVRWGSRFDRFVALPELWMAAGFSLDIPAESPAKAPTRVYTRRRGRLATLSDDARRRLADRYQAGDRLQDLRGDFDLKDAHDVYRILDDLGVPRRVHQKPKRKRRVDLRKE